MRLGQNSYKHRTGIFHACIAAESALIFHSLSQNNILELNLHRMIISVLLIVIK